MAELIDESSSLESTTIGVYRTASTVKGGRRFSFGALVVVGNRNGQVGFGYAKSKEVPTAIEKAQKYAKRSLINIHRIGTTINHEVEGRFSASKVRLIPAAPGTGVVAGTVVRSILEMAGVSDCLTKCYGSTNARNSLKATFEALQQIRPATTVAGLRGQDLGRTEIEDKIERGKAHMPERPAGQRARGPVNTLGSERRGRGGGGRPRRRDQQQQDAPAAAPSADAASQSAQSA
ncbi:MAG: 30S ribosomal protein S5 [Phycisphaeraceae bacterium]|nr:30S ribosomal protein S5 [Phycisphaeraceae bacterium]